MTAAELAGKLNAKRTGSGWSARCPAHDDRVQSLSITEGQDGKTLLHCFAGCAFEAIVAALGLETKDLSSAKQRAAKASRPRVVATYQYRDADGTLLYEIQRLEPKSFPQRAPDGNGGWKTGRGALDGVKRVPYRLPELIAAPSSMVWIPEGEKDCDNLAAAGLVSTTNSQGAGKWKPDFAEYLRGRDVAILPDNDDPGREHSRSIARSLHGIAASVKIVELPNLPPKGDASDFLNARGTKADLERLFAEALEWNAIETAPIGETLDSIVTFVRRYVFLSRSALVILALWIVHTHAVEAAEMTPFIAVMSAEKRSGKTRLLQVLELLVNEPMRVAYMSAATIYRMIEEFSPSLLVDEIDAIFSSKARANEEVRGVLNAGHSRGTKVPRMVGARMDEIKFFETFTPRVFAGLGELPDTLADRSFLIRMKRKTGNEVVDRFRKREARLEAEPLRQKASAWAEAHLSVLRDARPFFPEGISDRVEDGAEPLLAIADLAAGEWPERAQAALVELCGGIEASEDSAGLRLLRDVRAVFEEGGTDRFWSSDLCSRLNAIEESGWNGWNDGKGIKQRNLSKLLKAYGIKSRSIRLDDGTAKGFHLDQFKDAFSRYGPEVDFERHSGTTPENIDQNAFFASGTEPSCAGSESAVSTNKDGPCAVVPDESSSPDRDGAACAYFIGKSWSGACGRCGAPSDSHQSPDFDGFGVA